MQAEGTHFVFAEKKIWNRISVSLCRSICHDRNIGISVGDRNNLSGDCGFSHRYAGCSEAELESKQVAHGFSYCSINSYGNAAGKNVGHG